jgi:hypothetical protein
MKQLIACILILCATVGNILAQGAQAQMIKERAKQQRDANNQRQGLPVAPAFTPLPTAPQAPAGARAIDPAQQQMIDKLQTDLTAIKAGAPVTPEQKQELQNDFLTLSKGATKPSKDAVTKLANDLSAALANKNVSAKDQALLAKAINVVMNNGNLSPAQAQAFVTTAQNSLKASGVTESEAQTVASDLKAIVTELQKSKPKLYQ